MVTEVRDGRRPKRDLRLLGDVSNERKQRFARTVKGLGVAEGD